MMRIALWVVISFAQTVRPDGKLLLLAAKKPTSSGGPKQYMMAQDARYSGVTMSSTDAILSTSTTDTVTDCVRLCGREDDCVFFNRLTGVCQVLNVAYGKTISKVVKETGNVYYTKITQSKF